MQLASEEDALALHSQFPSWTLPRLREMLRQHRGHVKRAVRGIKAEIKKRYKAELSVAIIGGGIGGLALALALQQRGIRCRVFERDANFHERKQGYGLTMQQGTSALQSLGFTIGAGDNFGVHSTRHLVLTSDGRRVGEWGQRKWGGQQHGKQKAGKSNFHIPRQLLRKLLLDALRPGTVEWGHRFVDFAEMKEDMPKSSAATLTPCLRHARHKELEASLSETAFALDSMVSPVMTHKEPFSGYRRPSDFDLAAHPPMASHGNELLSKQEIFFPKTGIDFLRRDGTRIQHTASVVVGCDGINGAVRKRLVEDETCPLQYLGVFVVLGIVDNLLLDTAGADVADGKSAFQMSDGSVRLFGMPFDAEQTMWQLSFPMPEELAKAISSQGSAALKEEALRRCGEWSPPVPQLLRATAVDSLSGYPVYDRPLLTSACFKAGANAGVAVTLLGDAAHPMSPFKGQGANQALADAVVLARELSECGAEGPLPAILRFETEMMERSGKKVLASREAASFLHSEIATSEGDKPRGTMAAGLVVAMA